MIDITDTVSMYSRGYRCIVGVALLLDALAVTIFLIVTIASNNSDDSDTRESLLWLRVVFFALLGVIIGFYVFFAAPSRVRVLGDAHHGSVLITAFVLLMHAAIEASLIYGAQPQSIDASCRAFSVEARSALADNLVGLVGIIIVLRPIDHAHSRSARANTWLGASLIGYALASLSKALVAPTHVVTRFMAITLQLIKLILLIVAGVSSLAADDPSVAYARFPIPYTTDSSYSVGCAIFFVSLLTTMLLVINIPLGFLWMT